MRKDTMLSKFTAKLRDDKKLEILVYSALILAAVVIFLSTGGISCESTGKASAGEAQASGTRSATELETRLETVLSSIEGAGRVSVLIAYSDPAHGYDGAFSASAGQKESARSASGVSGAIVVAEGASDIGVRLRLENAVTALLGLEPDRVSVFPMNK